jgi:hypothetical protein
MRCGIVLACLTACAATLVAADGRARIAFPSRTPAKPQVPSGLIILELRVFDGAEEVTAHTRVTVHHAGARGEPLAQATSPDGRVQLQVPSGIYDVQAVHEQDGRVVNIRWANRLVVMAYPDEAGQHLEVINFKTGYGALQIRTKDGTAPDVAIYETGKREKPTTPPVTSAAYTLFIVPAATYDLQVRKGAETTWHAKVDVPLDRTRLWIVPDGP